ncbi:proton-coupled amino acid transporter-like protein CG1139 isoform X1 [Aedes albopictus]|uniref:Amino acid transporter transmembrane domain-containing protein n=2 Tax=Aedes albopictus TaxID=7160 RepID=A0ABM1YQM6_AEDAL
MEQKSCEVKEYNPFEHRKIEKPNSTIGTLIHLVKGTLGTGILSMPLAFRNGGFAFGIVGTVISGIIYAHCVYLLVSTSRKACRRSFVPMLGYTETVENVFTHGPRGIKKYTILARRCTDVQLLLNSYLLICVYLVFIGNTLRDIVNHDYQLEWDTRVFIFLAAVPLIFTTQIRELKYLVPFSAIANALIITAIGITMFYILKEPITLENKSMWPAWNTLPAFIGTVMYALLGIEYVLPNENKMKRPEHMLGNCGVVNVAVCFITALYTIVGALGYAQFGEDTKGSVTLNLPANEALAKSTQLLTITAIILSTGLINYVPTDILWRKVQHKIHPKRHNFAQIAFRFGMLVLLTAIAVGVPELEPFVGLTGSISGGSLVVIIPAVIDTVFRWPAGDFGRMNWILVKNVLVLVFGLLVLGIGTYFSVVDIIAIYEKE